MAKTKKTKPRLTEVHKYCTTADGIIDAANAAAEIGTDQWYGLIRLGCALQGMELIPYNNLDYMDRATYWVHITLEDAETYYIVPFNTFTGEHDGSEAK